MFTRSTFMPAASLILLLISSGAAHSRAASEPPRPNVILIMTDDQGIGDFGAMGNEVIETPHLDKMASNSATMTTFYVHPVCSPTRACLMTGRYNYRTRCIDTYLGRSMMEPEEVTVAEVLSDADYATGIFGKWHLGDCYPMRPMDQGFEEVLVHRGGGLAQPSEPRENNRRYTNPILFHNGEQVQTNGFCTDVYFDAAMRFIEKSRRDGRNFFVYLPTNAPHGPYHDVPENLRKHYMEKKEELAKLIVPDLRGQRLESEIDRLARIAAMITNVDQNVGRLFKKLEQLEITDDTLVIFLNDNGPNTRRYVGDLRGKKAEVHEGGVRAPLWLHWPAGLEKGYARDELSEHIDVMPTILDACDVAPSNVQLDGRSVLPLLQGKDVDWSDRTLAIQSHRGDVPLRYHNFMIRDSQWKLVHPSGFGGGGFRGEPDFQLYDITRDPDESRNLAEQEPQVVQRLKEAYDRWFDDVSSTRPDNYAPPRIWIGTPHEEETVLTRQDWRGGTWARNSQGFWLLHVATAGTYTVQFEIYPESSAGTAELRIDGTTVRKEIASNTTTCTFDGVELSAGDARLDAALTHNGQEHGVYQVMVRKQTVKNR